jgi:transcriptional regulator with XRE-family HTH domain
VGTEPLSDGSALGQLLRTYRLACSLSQEELGERAGVSVRTICNIESGRGARPYRKTVELLASALGLQGQQYAEFIRAVGHPAEAARAWAGALETFGVRAIA